MFEERFENYKIKENQLLEDIKTKQVIKFKMIPTDFWILSCLFENKLLDINCDVINFLNYVHFFLLQYCCH